MAAATTDTLERAPFLFPATFTEALSPDFVSDGPMLRAFIKLAWRTPENPTGLTLDLWQEWLIDRVLERYPLNYPDPKKAGRLRYRQCVISIPRQNGKSVLGAILALYGLLFHEDGPYVIGVASSAEQARIVYDRVLFVIQVNPALRRQFSKMTETRGIKTKDGAGRYEIKASKGAALQGLPTSMSIVDELHITAPPIWSALVNGTVARKNGLVLGITTAGDEDSELLKRLYDLGNKAAAGDKSLERFGFFCWQAPEGVVPADDDALAEWLLASNPSIYEGRLDVGSVVSDVRAEPEIDVLRYRGNLFVASQAAFIPAELWHRGERGAAFPTPNSTGVSRPVFAIDRTPDWGYATVTVTVKTDDGKTHTEVVASMVRPTLERLADLCVQLAPHAPTTFVVDGYSLRDLGNELKRRGLPVRITTMGDMLTASSMFYAKIAQGKLKHSADALLSRQIPRAVRKNVNDGFRISRKDSSEIDAVIATALGVFGAETMGEAPMQIF